MDEKLEAGKQSLQQIEVSTVTKTTAKADVANAINNKENKLILIVRLQQRKKMKHLIN